MKIILASKSAYRADILKKADIAIKQYPANIDERALQNKLGQNKLGQNKLGKTTPEEVAQFLANEKAKQVSEKNPNALVLGCDQILALENKILHKVKNKQQAKQRLQTLSGKTHFLYSALCLAKNKKIIWQYVKCCKMKMRTLKTKQIENYIESIGEDIVKTVGAYKIEKNSEKLFLSHEKDLTAIIGLPLKPLMKKLENIFNE